MNYDELAAKGLSPKVWSLIQRGLAATGHYDGKTFYGRPGPKTKAAYEAYMGLNQGGDDKSPFPWFQVACEELGVAEFPGAADNPKVTKYFDAVDDVSDYHGSQDETPWCSAFVNWCLDKVGVEGTKSAAARSWDHWGKPTDKPVPGCIVVLWRDNPRSWKGHVAFFSRMDRDYVYLLGGNQANKVKVSKYPRNRVLSFRIPG